MTVINLDCLSTDHKELHTWSFKHREGRREDALALFPDRPYGYRRTTKYLAEYAQAKAFAMHCRKLGDIERALIYEGMCERIYADLPEYARWKCRKQRTPT